MTADTFHAAHILESLGALGCAPGSLEAGAALIEHDAISSLADLVGQDR